MSNKIKSYNLKNSFYNPIDYVINIHDPKTGMSYPINKELLDIYLNQNIKNLVDKHKSNHDIFEREIIKDELNERMVYNNAPKDIMYLEEPDMSTTEFYTYIKLPKELKQKILKDPKLLTFSLYLEQLAYIGQGIIDKRGHDVKSVITIGGKQGEFSEEMEKNPFLYERVVSESNKFHLLDKAKEFASIMVYNYSNLYNDQEPNIYVPTNLRNSNFDELKKIIISFGIFTLYQNYIYLISCYDNQLNVQHIKNQNQERQCSISLTEEESRQILIFHINLVKDDLNKKIKNWKNVIKARISKFSSNKLASDLQLQLNLVDNPDLLFSSNFKYPDLIRHYDFIDCMYLSFNDKKNLLGIDYDNCNFISS